MSTKNIELNKHNMQVGLRLAKARMDVGMTLDEVARKLKLSTTAVFNYEMGRAMPVEYIHIIAPYLKVSPDWLLLGAEEETPGRRQRFCDNVCCTRHHGKDKNYYEVHDLKRTQRVAREFPSVYSIYWIRNATPLLLCISCVSALKKVSFEENKLNLEGI